MPDIRPRSSISDYGGFPCPERLKLEISYWKSPASSSAWQAARYKSEAWSSPGR